jgi:hypothetical protein
MIWRSFGLFWTVTFRNIGVMNYIFTVTLALADHPPAWEHPRVKYILLVPSLAAFRPSSPFMVVQLKRGNLRHFRVRHFLDFMVFCSTSPIDYMRVVYVWYWAWPLGLFFAALAPGYRLPADYTLFCTFWGALARRRHAT